MFAGFVEKYSGQCFNEDWVLAAHNVAERYLETGAREHGYPDVAFAYDEPTVSSSRCIVT
jgi:hypothetical protein